MSYQRPQSRNDFRIAIICALKLESSAARSMFDEEWEPPWYGKLPNDPNSYTTGRIGPHNVVLVYLPGMGAVPSASATANLRNTYPNVNLALLVGVCGGNPTGQDEKTIQLGDVVISTNVVQYAFGRRYPDRLRKKDTLQDSLSRPNTEIRTFLHKIDTVQGPNILKKRTGDLLTEKTIQESFRNCRRPSQKTDIVYPPGYRHKHQIPGVCEICDNCKQNRDEVCEVALKSSCIDLGCGEASSDARGGITKGDSEILKLLVPSIHFGTVASADEVMKSGIDRDRIAAEENAIAFEMEGAGSWDNVPTVVIKGVCDYADSHKNKDWQGYASLAAACCAKAFLEQWTPTDAASQGEALEPLSAQILQQTIPLHRNPYFMGRESVIGELEKTFGGRVDRRGIRTVALYGPAGVGKTQCATEYCHMNVNRYQGGIYWVNARNEQSIAQSLSERVEALAGKRPKDPLKVFWKTMEESMKASKSSLLILDDVSDVKTVLKFLKANCIMDIVVLTNDTSFLSSRLIPISINVSKPDDLTSLSLLLLHICPWTQEEQELLRSGEYVRQRTSDGNLPDSSIGEVLSEKRGIQTWAQLDDILRLTDNLPLAIVQCASYVKLYHVRYKGILAAFKTVDPSRRRRLLSHESQSLEYSESLMKTWEITFAQLKSSFWECSSILTLLGFLDRNFLSDHLLEDVLSDVIFWSGSARFEMPLELRETFSYLDPDNSPYFEAVGRLESLMLVERVANGQRITLHPLLHEWIHLRMQDDECAIMLQQTISLLYNNLPPQLYSADDKTAPKQSITVFNHLPRLYELTQMYKNKFISLKPDIVLFFLEAYLWYYGKEYLDLAEELIEKLEIDDRSWVERLIFMARVHSIILTFQESRSAKLDIARYEKIQDRIKSIGCSAVTSQTDRANLTDALIMQRLTETLDERTFVDYKKLDADSLKLPDLEENEEAGARLEPSTTMTRLFLGNMEILPDIERSAGRRSLVAKIADAIRAQCIAGDALFRHDYTTVSSVLLQSVDDAIQGCELEIRELETTFKLLIRAQGKFCLHSERSSKEPDARFLRFLAFSPSTRAIAWDKDLFEIILAFYKKNHVITMILDDIAKNQNLLSWVPSPIVFDSEFAQGCWYFKRLQAHLESGGQEVFVALDVAKRALNLATDDSSNMERIIVVIGQIYDLVRHRSTVQQEPWADFLSDYQMKNDNHLLPTIQSISGDFLITELCEGGPEVVLKPTRRLTYWLDQYEEAMENAGMIKELDQFYNDREEDLKSKQHELLMNTYISCTAFWSKSRLDLILDKPNTFTKTDIDVVVQSSFNFISGIADDDSLRDDIELQQVDALAQSLVQILDERDPPQAVNLCLSMLTISNRTRAKLTNWRSAASKRGADSSSSAIKNSDFDVEIAQNIQIPPFGVELWTEKHILFCRKALQAAQDKKQLFDTLKKLGYDPAYLGKLLDSQGIKVQNCSPIASIPLPLGLILGEKAQVMLTLSHQVTGALWLVQETIDDAGGSEEPKPLTRTVLMWNRSNGPQTHVVDVTDETHLFAIVEAPEARGREIHPRYHCTKILAPARNPKTHVYFFFHTPEDAATFSNALESVGVKIVERKNFATSTI